MLGLWENHAHTNSDNSIYYGDRFARLWLVYGITEVRAIADKCLSRPLASRGLQRRLNLALTTAEKNRYHLRLRPPQGRRGYRLIRSRRWRHHSRRNGLATRPACHKPSREPARLGQVWSRSMASTRNCNNFASEGVRLTKNLGTLEAGHLADLSVVSGDPL